MFPDLVWVARYAYYIVGTAVEKFAHHIRASEACWTEYCNLGDHGGSWSRFTSGVKVRRTEQ